MMKFELQTPHEATWTPILWALKLLERARTEGKIKVHALCLKNPKTAKAQLKSELIYKVIDFPK